MFSQLHLPRVLGTALTAFVVGLSLPSFGQNLDSGLERRASGRLDMRVLPGDGLRQDETMGEVKNEGLVFAAEAWALYDDNIHLSAANVQSDLVIRVAPSVAYIKGGADATEGGYARFAYKPTGVVYLDHSGANRVDQDGSWDIGLRGKKLAMAYGGRMQQLGDATADAGRQTDRLIFEQILRVAWTPREKLAIELAAGQSMADYRDRLLNDYDGTYGEVALRYAYSPKTRIGLIYRAGTYAVDGAPDQDVQRGTVRLEWKPREKIAFDLEAGAEHRRFALGSSTTPVIEAKARWQPRERTQVFLGGYRRTEVSSFFPGQNYDLTGVSAGIEQRMGEKWIGRLEGGVENASYSRVSGAGPANREDRIVFIRPSVRYEISDDFEVEWFYRYETNDSNQPGFGYDNNTIGVRIGYQF
jgi:hypothetical protein